MSGGRPNETLLFNCRVVTPGGIIESGWLHMRDGVIAGIGEGEADDAGVVQGVGIGAVEADVVRIDGEGCYALPGFIDVHVHGGAGCDFMTAGHAELAAITRFHAEHGTTAMLATTVTGSREELTRVLREVDAYRRYPSETADTALEQDGRTTHGAQLLGVHLEGPFISPLWKGAQNDAHIVPPSPEWLEQWAADFPGVIRLQTLAPELEGADAYIQLLVQHGIVAACGHTDAQYDVIERAAACGLSHAVHTFNAMRPLHHREPGTVGAVLTDDRIAAEVIADGKHVHPAAIRLLLAAKGVDRVLLVTDAIAAAGMPDGAYELGGLAVLVEGGTARLADSGNLAGSTLTMIEGFRYLVDTVGVTVEEAARMASLNPARQLGIDDGCGSLAPGKRADVLLVDERLSLSRVFIGGRELR